MSHSMISCLCVTRKRPDMLRRAVQCFRDQTYPSRELLVVYESDDDDTRRCVAAIDDPRIRPMEIPIAPKKTLGELRNLAIEASRGEYVTQWDDDDWYRQDRLSVQMEALLGSGKPACVLERWTCLDTVCRRAYVGRSRPWEGSILCRKDQIEPYADLAKREDTPVIETLAEQGKLHLLDRPEVYVYMYHGDNTWDRAHWNDVLHAATVLPWQEADELCRQVGVNGDSHVEPPHREYLEATRHWCDRAMERSPGGVDTSYYRFAGAPVRMRVAGPALAGYLKTTFEHLRVSDVDPDGPFALRIDAWDRKHTGAGCPGVPLPPEQTDLLDDGLVTHYQNDEILRYERGHYVNALDRPAGQVFTCRADGNDQALYERSKPFPNLLAVWYRDMGVQQLHAGLVAKDGRGVLIIGQSGSGKTTATLACALGGFDYLGDDHNGLQMTSDGVCRGYSFYNAARVGDDHLRHFPELKPFEVPPHNCYDHKSLVWMSQVVPQRTAPQCRIAAVVMPRIVPQGPTRFKPASKVQTLISLAPSTLKVPLSASYAGFVNLTDFIPKMPCFVMEMGPDVREIPGCVDRILDEAT